jgi:ribosomal protein S27E
MGDSHDEEGVAAGRGGSDDEVRLGDGTTIAVEGGSGSGARLSLHGARPFDAVRVDLDRRRAVELAGRLLAAARDDGSDAGGAVAATGPGRIDVTADGGARVHGRTVWAQCDDCGFSWTALEADTVVECPRCGSSTAPETPEGTGPR